MRKQQMKSLENFSPQACEAHALCTCKTDPAPALHTLKRWVWKKNWTNKQLKWRVILAVVIANIYAIIALAAWKKYLGLDQRSLLHSRF